MSHTWDNVPIFKALYIRYCKNAIAGLCLLNTFDINCQIVPQGKLTGWVRRYGLL